MHASTAELTRWLDTFAHDTPTVIVPIFDTYDDVIACIQSLRCHTPANVPILAIGDALADERISQALRAIDDQDQRFVYFKLFANSGLVGSANFAFERVKPRDVVLVHSDVIVPARWLERLRAAAYSQSIVATATPFTNHGSILSVPDIDQPSSELPVGMTLDQVDNRVRQTSLRLRPVLPSCIGYCVYIKRLALDAVGLFDEAFAPGYGADEDFSQRCVRSGLLNAACDDLFVYHKGSRSFGSDPAQKTKGRSNQSAQATMIDQRYPWYTPWRLNSTTNDGQPLLRALARARAALVGYRVAIDATSVTTNAAGTQVVALELTHAITRWLDAHRAEAPCPIYITVLLNDALPEGQFLELSASLNVVRLSQTHNDPSLRFDLIHRPFQVTTQRDLKMLETLGRRCIVSQLDCIAYTNPSYMHDAKGWLEYRRVNEVALATADGVIFISEEGRREAEQLGLQIPTERTRIIYVGVDHRLHSVPVKPPTVPETEGTGAQAHGIRPPYILVLGTNFAHKNRVFALRLAQALVRKYRWEGSLVFAGPAMTIGNAEADEISIETNATELHDRVVRLRARDETFKTDLIKEAALVLYPSLREGFGMVPFEAARLGTPALTLRIASMPEVLGDRVGYIESLDATEAADVAWILMTDANQSRAQVEAIQAQADRFTWDQVAEDTVHFYDHILSQAKRVPSVLRRAADLNESLQERSWLERARVAVRALVTQGWPGLRGTIDEYVNWRKGQF